MVFVRGVGRCLFVLIMIRFGFLLVFGLDYVFLLEVRSGVEIYVYFVVRFRVVREFGRVFMFLNGLGEIVIRILFRDIINVMKIRNLAFICL